MPFTPTEPMDCERRQRRDVPEISGIYSPTNTTEGLEYLQTETTSVEIVSQKIIEDGEIKGREQRVERITLSSGNILTATVTEADPETILKEQPDEPVEINFHVPGLGEIPSVKRSSGRNLHSKIAARTPNKRTVSIDRHGYSPEDPIDSPINIIKTGFETTFTTATDLLEAADHYSEGAETTAYAVSAGTEKILKMADINKLTGNKVKLAKEIRLVVPHLKVHNMPGQTDNSFTSQTKTRLGTIFNFAAHIPKNFAETVIQNPKEAIGCVGIMGALAKNPLIALSLPTRFIRHTEGIDYKSLARVLSKHTFNILNADGDPLNDKEQNKQLAKQFPERIKITSIKGAGHLLPINEDVIADHFFPDKEVKKPEMPDNVIQLAGHAATSLANKLSSNPKKVVGGLLKIAA